MSATKCRDIIERVFSYLDEDGDGKITYAELGRCVAAIKHGEAVAGDEVEKMVKLLDSDGDGLLGLDDFVGIVEGDENKGEHVEEEEEEELMKELKEAFEMYVMDGHECITPKSLMRMLSQLGETKTIDECRVMIEKFDLNGDGELNFDEFRIMIML